MNSAGSVLESNKQVARGFFQAISERRMEDLPKYMALDVIDHNKIIYGEDDVPGAAFEGLRQQLAAFNPAEFRIDELIAEDNRVVARITQHVVHSGTHPRMPVPPGRSATIEVIFILTLNDGKIKEIRAVSDRLGLFLQLGWDWPEVD